MAFSGANAVSRAIKIGRLRFKKIVGDDPEDVDNYTDWVMENAVLSDSGIILRNMEFQILAEEMERDGIEIDTDDPEETQFNVAITRDISTGLALYHHGLTTDGIFRFKARTKKDAIDWVQQISDMLNMEEANRRDQLKNDERMKNEAQWKLDVAKLNLGEDEPWLAAVQSGNLKDVKSLVSRAKKKAPQQLKEGSKMKKMDKEEIKKAIAAAEAATKNKAKRAVGEGFLKSCNFSIVSIDVRKRAAIHIAATQGYTKILKLVIREMLRARPVQDIDLKDSGGWTALHLACTSGQRDCVRALLKAKASIRVINNHGFTPLHCAAGRGHTDIVSILIENGANVFAVTDDAGNSPLHLAAKEGYLEISKLLILAGCEFRSRNKKGVSSFDLACYRQHTELMVYFQSMAPANPEYPITKSVKKLFRTGAIRKLKSKAEQEWQEWEDWNNIEAEAPPEEQSDNQYNRPIP